MANPPWTDPAALFETTAGYYARYRPPYPSELFQLLVDRFRLGSSTTVLDLGCGTGQIAVPLAERGIPVLAVDPSIEMLCEGMHAAARASAYGVAWCVGDDRGLSLLHIPPLRLCAMGASFHWTDRDVLLRTLDEMVVPEGGIALVSSTASVWRDAEGDLPIWAAIAKDVVRDLLGPERRAGHATYEHPADRHEVVLARSAFSRFEAFQFPVLWRATVDEVIGLQLSTSYASPARLGPILPTFCEELGRRLREAAPQGTFEDRLVVDVLLAER